MCVGKGGIPEEGPIKTFSKVGQQQGFADLGVAAPSSRRMGNCGLSTPASSKPSIPPLFRDGEWQLSEVSGWPDKSSYLNLVAWCWRYGAERVLVAVNLSGSGNQARVRIPWPEVAGQTWRLIDEFSGEGYLRNGNELCDPGLYVGLEPWDVHFLKFES